MTDFQTQLTPTGFSNGMTTDGYVSAEEVLKLRQDVFRNGVVDMTEAEELFSMADVMPDGDREWPEFFTEALTDYFVNQAQPAGYISQNHASYLIGRFGPASSLNPLKFKLLVQLLKKAKSTPQCLLNYAFEVTHAHVLADGCIKADEVSNLRVFLTAAGGDDNATISKAEAELMFDLNDATSASDANAPEWAELFKQVIANYLMAHIGYTPLSRAEMLQTETALKEQPKGIIAMLSNIAGGLGQNSRTNSVEEIYAKRNAERAADAANAAKITPEETDWLIDRLNKDGTVDTTEQSMLRHLKKLVHEHGAILPEKLSALTQKVA